MSYVAIVLDEISHNKLVKWAGETFSTLKANINGNNWEVICHHMTIKMGDKLPEQISQYLGDEVTLEAFKYGFDEKVIAVKVMPANSNDGGIHILDDRLIKLPHVTVAVNRANGGKPVMSGLLTNWKSMEPLKLKGIVKIVQ